MANQQQPDKEIRMAVRFCPTLSLLLLLHSIFLTVSAQSNCEIPLKSAISTSDSTRWLSPSRDFAFGFLPAQQAETGNFFLLSIWFNKISDQTIVWSANGNKPAPEGSKITLTEKGELLLTKPDGDLLWRAETNKQSATCAAMLDSGNFVLNHESDQIWESFSEPTDTILPGQNLSSPSNLTSRSSKSDFSDGRFQFHFQTDGNLVLYSLSSSGGAVYGPYWATNTYYTTSKLVFNEEGYFYQELNSVRIRNFTTKNPGLKDDYYHLIRLDVDGVLREYKHPKSVDQNSCASPWTTVFEVPDNICNAIALTVGSGACGFNSYCLEVDMKAGCFCPDGFSLLNPLDESKGCKPDFQLPSCEKNGNNDEQKLNDMKVSFKELPFVDWPNSDYDLLQLGNGELNKETCRKLCENDCFCAVAVYGDNRCWKKRLPLSNGRQHPNRTTLFKIIQFPENKDQSALIIAGSVLLGSSGVLNLILLFSILAFFFMYKNSLNSQKDSTSLTTTVRSCSYKELEEASNGFKQILGKGSFGTVYKGVLSQSSSNVKKFVAIKRLDGIAKEGDREFRTEVSVIGQTHHKNLVRLLGYCEEDDHRLLVYEYMSNGSLSSFLFGITKPDWNQRVHIACGIARGLMYLHEECDTQIIHCDIKPQNILLDEYFTPRIADFGLAKLLLSEQSRAARTAVRGTIGYFAPEWFSRRQSITVKVDVYSFGVMLLEIVCLKSSLAFSLEKNKGDEGDGDDEESLVDWIYRCYKDGALEKVVENDEEGKSDMQRVQRLVMVGIWCIQEDPSLRPAMKKVTQMLEGVLQVSVPPRPYNT